MIVFQLSNTASLARPDHLTMSVSFLTLAKTTIAAWIINTSISWALQIPLTPQNILHRNSSSLVKDKMPYGIGFDFATGGA